MGGGVPREGVHVVLQLEGVRQPVAVAVVLALLGVEAAGDRRDVSGVEDEGAAEFFRGEGVGEGGIEVFVFRRVGHGILRGVVVHVQAAERAVAEVRRDGAAVVEGIVGHQSAHPVLAVQLAQLVPGEQVVVVRGNLRAGALDAPDADLVDPQAVREVHALADRQHRPAAVRLVEHPGGEGFLVDGAGLLEQSVDVEGEAVLVRVVGAGEVDPAAARQRLRRAHLVPLAADRVEAEVRNRVHRHRRRHRPADAERGHAEVERVLAATGLAGALFRTFITVA